MSSRVHEGLNIRRLLRTEKIWRGLGDLILRALGLPGFSCGSIAVCRFIDDRIG